MRFGLRVFAMAVSCAILASGLTVDAGIRVSPSRIVLQGKPRQKLSGTFHVENPGPTPVEVRVEPEDWSGGITGSRGQVSWLSVHPETLIVKPGKRAKVQYTIRIPAQASGELRSQVFFTANAPASESETSIHSRLGTIVYVGIQGTERIDAEIGEVSVIYSASTPDIAQPDRLEAVIRVRNRGNVHLIPEGEVSIRNEEGQVVASVTLPPGWGLLPGEEEEYHAIGHGVHLAPGPYQIDITIRGGADFGLPIVLTKSIEWRFDNVVAVDKSTKLLENTGVK